MNEPTSSSRLYNEASIDRIPSAKAELQAQKKHRLAVLLEIE